MRDWEDRCEEEEEEEEAVEGGDSSLFLFFFFPFFLSAPGVTHRPGPHADRSAED